MVELIIFKEGGEIKNSCVLKEEITETPTIKCGNIRDPRRPSELTNVLVLQECFRWTPTLSREQELHVRRVLHQVLRSPSRTFLKTHSGQCKLLLSCFNVNHFREWPKVLQRAHKTQVFDLCGFAMYVF